MYRLHCLSWKTSWRSQKAMVSRQKVIIVTFCWIQYSSVKDNYSNSLRSVSLMKIPSFTQIKVFCKIWQRQRRLLLRRYLVVVLPLGTMFQTFSLSFSYSTWWWFWHDLHLQRVFTAVFSPCDYNNIRLCWRYVHKPLCLFHTRSFLVLLNTLVDFLIWSLFYFKSPFFPSLYFSPSRRQFIPSHWKQWISGWKQLPTKVNIMKWMLYCNS